MKRQSSIALLAAFVASVAGCTGDPISPRSDLGVHHDLGQADMTDLTLIDPLGNNPQVQKINTGMTFTVPQSPLWLAKSGTLLFTDTPASIVYQLTPPATLAQYRSNSNKTNGLALDPQGNIVMCELSSKQVTRRDQSGNISVVASMYMGKPFNGPNDAIVRSDGIIYFTDPGAGSLGYEGLYSIAPGNNTVTLLDQSMKNPNGIA
jgi:gluconolactonase